MCLCSRASVYSARARPRDDPQMADRRAVTLPSPLLSRADGTSSDDGDQKMGRGKKTIDGGVETLRVVFTMTLTATFHLT